nr:Insulinase (Peptidase M16) [Polyrhizophydium stewartii]
MRSPAAVRRPDGDDREYAVITLPNGLQAVVISDPATDKAAAALDVHVGHLCDHDDVAGLAHFCEHLLFMITPLTLVARQYPVENEYSQFLSAHGGSSNAFTSADHTNYYFDVAADHLEGALDRFAQFFISPLFSESCTEREMNAVDSEHKKNLQNDMWRSYQLDKDLSNPKHPYVKFGTGDLVTLRDIPASKGIDVRKVLLDFHDQFYSANIMKVAVLGKQPIDVLAAWAVSMFSPIKNKSIAVPTFGEDVLTAAELQKEIRVKPVKEVRKLTITFPCHDPHDEYRAHPFQYASHLIGHESKGSILSLLKEKGLSAYHNVFLQLSLSAGPSGGCGRGFELVRVNIELTEKGLEHYEDIVVIVFQYIAMLRSMPVQEWVFRECQAVAAIAFRFKEKSPPSSFVSHLAGNLHLYVPEDVISGPYLLEVFDSDAIRRVLDRLTPSQFRITLQSPTFDTDGWSEAPHYGTKFRIGELSPSLKQRLASLGPNAELHLPEPNSFIPEDFTVERVRIPKPATHPLIIADTPLIRLWHKRDDTFFVPKANAYFALTSPLAYESVLSCVLTRLFADLFKDALNEFSYYAEIAGLEYKLDNTVDGMTLTIHGYNDKIHVLLGKIGEKMKSFTVDESQFARIKERLAKSYKNFAIEAPHSHAIYYITLITQQRLFTHAEKLAVLGDITAADVQAFAPKLIERLHIQALVHGNVSKERAIELGNILVSQLAPAELAERERFPSVRTRIMPQGSSIIHQRLVPNPANLNSGIEYCIQVGALTDQYIRTHLSLISQIAHEPAFDQLRTKEQLGYLVFSGIRKQTGLLSFRFIIESERDPAFLESRIDSFIDKFETMLSEMSAEEYAKHQAALVTKILEKLKNLGQESQRLWGHVSALYYDFEQHLHDAEQIPLVSKDSLLAFFRKHISPSSTTRRKVSVHMRSQKVAAGAAGPEGEAVLARSLVLDESADLSAFKESLELSEPAKPVKPVESWMA